MKHDDFLFMTITSAVIGLAAKGVFAIAVNFCPCLRPAARQAHDFRVTVSGSNRTEIRSVVVTYHPPGQKEITQPEVT